MADAIAYNNNDPDIPGPLLLIVSIEVHGCAPGNMAPANGICTYVRRVADKLMSYTQQFGWS